MMQLRSTAENDPKNTTTTTSTRLSSRPSINLREDNDVTVQPNVIAITGLGCLHANEWGLEDELHRAAASVETISKLHTYVYQSPDAKDDNTSWAAFLKNAGQLAENIGNLALQFPDRPMIFIVHSLGGILLKKALLLADEHRHHQKFRLLMDCLAGILFLGTPHSGKDDADTLFRINQVLFQCIGASLQKKSSKLNKQEVHLLSDLAVKFESVISTVRVLSVFDSHNPRSTFRNWVTKPIIVDEELVTIHTDLEETLGVQRGYKELCNIPQVKNIASSAQKFLNSLLQDIAVKEEWTTATALMREASISSSSRINPLKLTPIVVTTRTSIDGRQGIHYQTFAKEGTTHPERGGSPPLVGDGGERLLQGKHAVLPCFTLQQTPNEDFIGRAGLLKKLDAKLWFDRNTQLNKVQKTRYYAICGMGGIGKTSTAIEYAFARRDQYDAIFWVEAAGASQLASNFARISVQLGLEDPDAVNDLETSVELAKAWLKHSYPFTWLLIFDNADNLEVLTNYIPQEGNGSVLVTSRDPFAKDHFFSGDGGVDLRPLNTDESATLLRQLVTGTRDPPNKDEEYASIMLAKKLDGLPLAMTQMAGYMRKRRISIREFVDTYDDARYAQIRHLNNPLQQKRYGYTLATAYSFDGLPKNAVKLLQLTSFLNPDRIQEIMFTNPQLKNHPDLAFESALSLEDARYELLACSIMKRDVQKKELCIHRLIQQEVRINMDDRDRYERFLQSVRLVNTSWPPGNLSTQSKRRWALCEELLPHLEQFQAFYMEYADDWEKWPVSVELPKVLNEAAIYLHERGFSQEGKAYLRLALDLCERANITQEPLVSDMHLTMGALCNETNDPQACFDHNVICMQIRRKEAEKTNKPDLRLAFAYSQMGTGYMVVGKYASAEMYFKQSIELLKAIEPKIDADEYGFPVCNLGLAHWIQGDLDNADKILTDLLHQREALHGKLDKVSYKTGRVLQALGNVRHSKAIELQAEGNEVEAQRFFDESFELHYNCLQQYESTLGASNHRTADACHKLAEHYIRRGDHMQAQDYLDRALSIWGDRQWFRNESARSSFLRGIHLMSFEDAQSKAQGKQWVDRAKFIRRQILSGEEERELETKDFDDIVCFWSI